MKRLTIAAAVVSSLSFPVFAQPAPPPPPAPKAAVAPAPAPAPATAGMDMSKMGPQARKPTNEAKTKKEIEAFIKEEDTLFAKRDWEGMANRVDFPVYMLTDTLAGVPSGEASTREAYLASMKPSWEMMPPGTTTKHKLTISVLSDSLANVVDDYEMTMGKQKMKGRNASTVARVNGQWRFKTMTEAGWGDAGGPPAAAAPAKAPPPPAAAPAPAPAPAPGKAPPPPPPPAKK